MLTVIGQAAGWLGRLFFKQHEQPAFESPMEARFWDEATRQGIELKSQHRIGPYRADFVVLPVEEYRLVVEVDGKDYHSSEDQVCRDYEREWYLLEQGWVVFRVRGRQVWRQPRESVARLKKIMERRQVPWLKVSR